MDNAVAALASAGLPSAIANNSLFPLDNGAASALDNLFNFTARASTDALFRCLDQATAVSGVKHNLFKDVWFYEFNRGYQTPGFDPNAPRCDAPVDADHPAGNPDAEYYKYVFLSLSTTLTVQETDTGTTGATAASSFMSLGAFLQTSRTATPMTFPSHNLV